MLGAISYLLFIGVLGFVMQLAFTGRREKGRASAAAATLSTGVSSPS
jgi:hypothetical protein